MVLNPQHDGYQRELVSMVHKLFNKKTGSTVNLNKVLAQELHMPVIKNKKKKKRKKSVFKVKR